MLFSPELHEPTFARIAVTSVRGLAFDLRNALRELKSDRGPSAVTAGVFYQMFERMHKKATSVARIKLQFGPTPDSDARKLCREVERLLKDFEHVFLDSLRKHAFDTQALIQAFLNEGDRAQSLLTVCADYMPKFEAYLRDLETFLKKWPPSDTPVSYTPTPGTP